MNHTEISLTEALTMLKPFAPVKVSFNGVLLYNDYDGDDDGESEPLWKVISMRLWQAEKYVVTDIKVSIVHFHHGIIELTGRYETED